MKKQFYIVVCLCLSFWSFSQDNEDKKIRDKALDNVSTALFDAKSKENRALVKSFEDRRNVKLEFRVDEQSLDKIGGLSEYIFKLYQTFSTPLNTNARTITGEFSAIDDEVISDKLNYKTYATQDLRSCFLPIAKTDSIDSLYNANFRQPTQNASDYNIIPENIREVLNTARVDYDRMLVSNSTCPSLNGANPLLYQQLVAGTAKKRAQNWVKSINDFKFQLFFNNSQLLSPSQFTPYNAANVRKILNKLEPTELIGNHVINLNNSLNECTERDMEMKCRLLYKKTGIRFFFLTGTVDFFIPADSLNAYRDSVVDPLFRHESDKNLIVALWLKMKDDSALVSTGHLFVKQNGTWLSNADILFAMGNNGDKYTPSTLYTFLNLYRNIPKPLILCHQVAKVNGLLTTAYFSKGENVKGRDQIYYHAFSLDKGFRELSQLYSSRDALISQKIKLQNENPYLESQLADIEFKIKDVLINSARNPQFEESEVHFKDPYLEYKTVAQAGALKEIQKYGGAYVNAKVNDLIAEANLPEDLATGACRSNQNSDVAGDVLSIASLLLSPTGLDFIPDALSVIYYAAQNKMTDCSIAAASLLVAGNFSALSKVLDKSTDIVKEVHLGNVIQAGPNGTKAIQCDKELIAAVFNVELKNADQAFMSKLNNNQTGLRELMFDSEFKGTLFSNVSNKLDETKRVEFVEKALDDASWRKKVLDDPDEVLKWAGVLSSKLKKQQLRIAKLKSEFGDLDFTDFVAQGKSILDLPKKTHDEMFTLIDKRKNWSEERKLGKLRELIESGKELPVSRTVKEKEELYKLVLKNDLPSQTTEYWMTKKELEEITKNGINFESKAGLPLGSFADEYDIFKIVAIEENTVYENVVAPTLQRGFKTEGGLIQSLVLDRSSWSTPVKINTTTFIPEF